MTKYGVERKMIWQVNLPAVRGTGLEAVTTTIYVTDVGSFEIVERVGDKVHCQLVGKSMLSEMLKASELHFSKIRELGT